jgi:molybdate transport system substrate-binding protein
LANDLTILCTLGLRGAMTALAPALAARGLNFTASYTSTNALLGKIAAGERADIAILIDGAIDDLIAQGTLLPPRRDIARSGVGLAVKAGAPHPDIATVETLKAALLAARSVGYTVNGASGIHFADVLRRLGIADAVNARAVHKDGVVGERAANGEVEIAVQQLSELDLVAGIDIVGPLPDELQKYSMFSAGIFADSPRAEAARALIAALAAPEVAPVMRTKGLEPAGALV